MIADNPWGATTATDDDWIVYRITPAYANVDLPDDSDEKARLAQQHKEECRRAFSRPPKRCGRGRPPLKKWGPRRR